MFKDYMKKKAMKMAAAAMLDAAEDDTQDVIKLVKEPGKPGGNNLNVKVHMECSQLAILPYYVGRIIGSAAQAADVSPKEMAKLAVTFLELLDEFCTATNTTIKEEDK